MRSYVNSALKDFVAQLSLWFLTLCHGRDIVTLSDLPCRLMLALLLVLPGYRPLATSKPSLRRTEKFQCFRGSSSLYGTRVVSFKFSGSQRIMTGIPTRVAPRRPQRTATRNLKQHQPTTLCIHLARNSYPPAGMCIPPPALMIPLGYYAGPGRNSDPTNPGPSEAQALRSS
eukprot:1078718-Rhodomonas_salina.1